MDARQHHAKRSKPEPAESHKVICKCGKTQFHIMINDEKVITLICDACGAMQELGKSDIDGE